MTRARPRNRWLTLPVGLVGLLCLGSSALGADAGAPAESVQQLRNQIAELRLHVQGMEGKLKESAHARKAADQGRMDAERRLAEVSQEVEQLREAMASVERERSALKRQLDASDAETRRLTGAMTAARKTSDEARASLQALQALLPEAQGGTLTEAAARASAAEAFVALRKARATLEGHAMPAMTAAVASAELELRRRQLRLASVINAQSLYRIRPNDSLALIAARAYGAGSHWQTIFQANGHLLRDANRLTPGMTLVIP